MTERRPEWPPTLPDFDLLSAPWGPCWPEEQAVAVSDVRGIPPGILNEPGFPCVWLRMPDDASPVRLPTIVLRIESTPLYPGQGRSLPPMHAYLLRLQALEAETAPDAELLAQKIETHASLTEADRRQIVALLRNPKVGRPPFPPSRVVARDLIVVWAWAKLAPQLEGSTQAIEAVVDTNYGFGLDSKSIAAALTRNRKLWYGGC